MNKALAITFISLIFFTGCSNNEPVKTPTVSEPTTPTPVETHNIVRDDNPLKDLFELKNNEQENTVEKAVIEKGVLKVDDTDYLSIESGQLKKSSFKCKLEKDNEMCLVGFYDKYDIFVIKNGVDSILNKSQKSFSEVIINDNVTAGIYETSLKEQDYKFFLTIARHDGFVVVIPSEEKEELEMLSRRIVISLE